MIIQEKESIKRDVITQKENNQNGVVSSSSLVSPKKFDNPITNIPQLSPNSKVDRGLVFEKIKELSPINITALSRELPYSRSSVYYVVKALEYAGLIETKTILKDNHCERLVLCKTNSQQKIQGEHSQSNSESASNSINKIGDGNERD